MESEEAIAARLRGNIPVSDEPEVKPEPAKPAPTGQANTAVPFNMDELTLYKLHDFFGETYSQYDTESAKQAKFIYEEVAKLTGSSEYADVVARAGELMRQIGVSISERKMYKLYQWLKLDGTRQRAELEMGALSE